MSAETTSANLTRRLGGYEIVRSIETGPISSTMIGVSKEDPSRPTLAWLHRISPGKYESPKAEAFLASVRAAARLRHPNLVEVRETARAGDALFVASELVRGESLFALIQQLHVEGEQVQYGVVAHVIAEVASGLHVAHEQGIRHEHLTPHEILVGYDGRVKVKGVGVASAIETLTGATSIRAEELPYASPERCKGEALDQRTDVFALGAILWELMTGASPFARTSEADTIRAILAEEPMVPPAEVLRALPTQLSEIALKAISADPAKRYASARALRHELRLFVRASSLGVEPQAAVAELMRDSFGARIQNIEELVRTYEGTSLPPPDRRPMSEPPPTRPTGATTSEPAVAVAPPPPPVFAAPEDVPISEDFDDAPRIPLRSGSRRGMMIAAVVVIVAIGGGAAALLARPSSGPVAATGASDAVPSASHVAVSLSAQQRPAASAAPTEQITVSIDTRPPKASIVVGGTVMGVSPFDLKLPKGREPVTVEIQRPGYQTLRETVVPDVDQRLRLTLLVSAAAHPTPSASGNPYHRFD
jgi:eukaryotic-like serine/threonine-protein kinase